MCAILIFKALRLARVNEVSHSFTCHPHVYSQMVWAILPLLPPAAEHHRTMAGIHFPSLVGKGAELAWVVPPRHRTAVWLIRISCVLQWHQRGCSSRNSIFIACSSRRPPRRP